MIAERRIAPLDLTSAERAFAIDKGGKIVDFAVRGFWKQHEQFGVRHVTTAAACAYALAWLEEWANCCEAGDDATPEQAG
jgi:hypothetical protein